MSKRSHTSVSAALPSTPRKSSRLNIKRSSSSSSSSVSSCSSSEEGDRSISSPVISSAPALDKPTAAVAAIDLEPPAISNLPDSNIQLAAAPAKALENEHETNHQVLNSLVSFLRQKSSQLQQDTKELVETGATLVTHCREAPELQYIITEALPPPYQQLLLEVINSNVVDLSSPHIYSLLALLVDKQKSQDLLQAVSQQYSVFEQGEKAAIDIFYASHRKLGEQVKDLMSIIFPLYQELAEILAIAKDLDVQLSAVHKTTSSTVLVPNNNSSSDNANVEKQQRLAEGVDDWCKEMHKKLLACIREAALPGERGAVSDGVISPHLSSPRLDESVQTLKQSPHLMSSSMTQTYPKCQICHVYSAGMRCVKCRFHQCDVCLQRSVKSKYYDKQPKVMKVTYFCAKLDCKTKLKTCFFPIDQ